MHSITAVAEDHQSWSRWLPQDELWASLPPMSAAVNVDSLHYPDAGFRAVDVLHNESWQDLDGEFSVSTDQLKLTSASSLSEFCPVWLQQLDSLTLMTFRWALISSLSEILLHRACVRVEELRCCHASVLAISSRSVLFCHLMSVTQSVSQRPFAALLWNSRSTPAFAASPEPC